jgi:prevent-host-death family protein
MNLAHAIEPVGVLKTQSAALIKKARHTRQPIVITQKGKPAAVLQDVESYQRQRETLFLLKLLTQGDEDYRNGRTLSHEQAKKRLTAKLEELKSRV